MTVSSEAGLERLAKWCFWGAFLATIAIHISQAGSAYVYRHGFVSADVSTAARTFAHYGVINLRGVPVNNNPPLDLQNDAYTHWPPLLPILLSVCFRLFGESEIVTHVFVLGVLLFSTLCLYKIAKAVVGSPTAELSGFFWLTLPVIVNRGDIASQQLLAVLFILTAILAWIKAVQQDRPSKWWAALGVVAAGLGVLSSWEAVLLAPGLWVATMLNRRKEVWLTAAYTLSIGVSVTAVVWLYAMAAPQLFVDAIQTAKFRMGLSPAYSHLIVHHSSEGPLSLADTMLLAFFNHFFMLGVFGLAAVFMLALGEAKRFPKRSEDSVTVLCGMAAPWILWCVLMRDHVAVHDFEVLTAAPLASLALAIMATSALRQYGGGGHPWVAGTALLAFVSLPVVMCTLAGLNTDKRAGQLIEVAGVMERSTEAGAVILWSGDSMLPVYYSHRHVIRLVSNSQVAAELLTELRRTFPNAPFYLAMPREIEGCFSEILKNRIVDTKEIVVFRVR